MVVELGVVVFADATETLPHGEMLGVDGDTVVLGLAARTDICPSALLLFEIETGGVGKEEIGQDHARQTEPRDDVEFLLGSDVVVEHGGEESAHLTDGGGETVGGGTDGCGEDLSGDKEGDGVGTELVEEGGEEVHGLESMDTHFAGIVRVVEGGDDKEDEIHQESNLLHHLAAVVLVVDQES